METLPIGWTVHTWEQQGHQGTTLLKRGSADKTSTHVHDLFHEDAQVLCFQTSSCESVKSRFQVAQFIFIFV